MKPWYASKTVLGIAVAAIGALLALAGVEKTAWGPLLVVGLTAAGFGRAVAQGPLTARALAPTTLLPVALLLGACSTVGYVDQDVHYARGEGGEVLTHEDGRPMVAHRECSAFGPTAFGFGTAAGCAESLALAPDAAPEDPAGSPTRVIDAREIAGAHGGRVTPTGAEAAQGIVPGILDLVGRALTGVAGGGGG